ncbi:helix-turn-helix transcriptional regulator [Streptomyces sp. TRM64462]|uniref:helix-turn-helix domain-containing protein n=1 Tax=Streptomyces sp. TRM64462 TaxID=2741726 RepID=UPI0028152718|nr:helix-turn-helix transcriptional regulator [Streptomyces sp. TRM64462]
MKLVGALVGQFREAAGLTQKALGDAVGAGEETIASIEQGRRTLKPDLAKALDRLLETKGALETAVANMPEIDRIPVWAEQYMDLEREAIVLEFFANQVLPGLLQPKSYAEAVFRSRVPALCEDDIAAMVQVRLERQEILHRKTPPMMSFILAEAIVRAPLGGTEAHRETLRHLLKCADLPGVSIQVMPTDRATHAALDGPFVLLETPDYQHLAYTETQRGSQLITDPDETSILAQRYAMLRTQALNPEDTKGLLEQLLGEQ